MNKLALVPHVEVISDTVIRYIREMALTRQILVSNPIQVAYRGRICQGEPLRHHPEVNVILGESQIVDLNQFIPWARQLIEKGQPFGTSAVLCGDWAWFINDSQLPILPRWAGSPEEVIDMVAWAARNAIFRHVHGLQFGCLSSKGGATKLQVLLNEGTEPANQYDLVDPSQESRRAMLEQIRQVRLGEIPPFLVAIETMSGPVTLRFSPVQEA